MTNIHYYNLYFNYLSIIVLIKHIFSRVSSSFKHNASFVSRLPTIRRHKSTSLHSPSMHKGPQRGSCRTFAEMNTSAENLGNIMSS